MSSVYKCLMKIVLHSSFQKFDALFQMSFLSIFRAQIFLLKEIFILWFVIRTDKKRNVAIDGSDKRLDMAQDLWCLSLALSAVINKEMMDDEK